MQDNNNHKYKALDSLRGIAAMFVIFEHYFPQQFVPWHFYQAGNESVILFFILSGFVLSVMLNKVNLTYTVYVIRRIFRIYPIYLIVFLSFIGLIHFFPGIEPIDTKIHGVHTQIILLNIALILTANNPYDGVVWSLYYEMLISLIFPILFWLYKVKIKSIRNELVSSSIILILGLYLHHKYTSTSIASILYYIWYFILGILLYKHRESLKPKINIAIFTIGIILYFSRFSFFGIYSSEALRNFLTAIGSVILIYHALYFVKFTNFLSTPILLFLGRISYPLYLIHMPIIATLRFFLHYNLSNFQISIIAIPIVIILSALLNIFIEIPFIKLSKTWF
ncbi:MAG: hypothetical protein QG673_1628 [Pseudomonadota bacterium]|nr:hypothetical protein [Pseudomonadota bacterium]